jgi:hypothetical protein
MNVILMAAVAPFFAGAKASCKVTQFSPLPANSPPSFLLYVYKDPPAFPHRGAVLSATMAVSALSWLSRLSAPSPIFSFPGLFPAFPRYFLHDYANGAA